MALGGLAYNGSISTERLTATLSARQPKISNAVLTRNPLVEFFKKKIKTYAGGSEIRVDLRYKRSAKLGEAGGTGAWSYYDQLSVTPTDTVKAMGEPWSNLNVPIAISHQEKWENDGENVFDLVKTKTTFAEDDLADDLEDVLWGISGGDGAKLPTSLIEIVSGSDAGTLYGLSKAANTFLYSQEINGVGDLETNLIDQMRYGELLTIDNAPNKQDKIDAWFTHRDVYLGLENTLPQYIQVKSTADADLGFDEIMFNKVPVRWSSRCPKDSDQKYQMFGLMTKYWELAIRRQVNFIVTPFKDMSPTQMADVAQLLVSLGVICNNPRTNLRMKGIVL